MALDSHVHCGLTLPLERVAPLWQKGDISGGVLFSPVEEIYDRSDYFFKDSEYYRQLRRKVHHYLESLISEHIFVYWFVWNDFKLPADGFTGIKWHRHSNEPEYNYNSDLCNEFVEHVCQNRLPILYEEEFTNTIKFVKMIKNRTPIIIPHFGLLNGGYKKLKQADLFENPSIYVDTALADACEIADFATDYGVDRILFGSDFPFGNPVSERHKVEQVFSGKDLEKVLALNILELLGAR